MKSDIPKALCLVGGLLTLISTYILALYTIDQYGTTYYVYGIGGFKAILDMITLSQVYAIYLRIPAWLVYIIALVIFLFLISGAFILIGARVQAFAFIGSIITLFVGIIILLGTFGILKELKSFFDVMGDPLPLMEGIIPFRIDIVVISLGTVLLLVGGSLGLAGGIYSVLYFKKEKKLTIKKRK